MPRSTLTDPVRELIQGRNFCHVATLNENGSIHATLVWSDVDGDHVVLNSAQGRRWPENVKRTGRATLLIANAENQYEYVFIHAVLDSASEDDGRAVIDALSEKYEGRPYPPLKPGEVRVTLRFAPERVVHRGGQLHVDHVIWVAGDLHPAADRLAREYGLPDGGGGRHVGIGTHNRVFGLGGGYLEVLAVADPDEAAASRIGRAVAGAPDGLFGWAAAVEDVPAHAQRLGLQVTTIERDGLTARLAGVAEAMAEPWLPFFIQRDAGIEDPGAGGNAGGIAWVELAGDAERLRAWLGGEELPVRYAADDTPGLRAVGLGSGAVIR